MVNVQKLLKTISNDECIVLSANGSECVVDADDTIEVVSGVECVILRVGPNETAPVPVSVFDDATVMSKEEFIFRNMLEMMMSE